MFYKGFCNKVGGQFASCPRWAVHDIAGMYWFYNGKGSLLIFQLSAEVSFGLCFIKGFATKRDVSCRHASCEPCTTSPECIGFTKEKGILLIFQLSPEVPFGTTFYKGFSKKAGRQFAACQR